MITQTPCHTARKPRSRDRITTTVSISPETLSQWVDLARHELRDRSNWLEVMIRREHARMTEGK